MTSVTYVSLTIYAFRRSALQPRRLFVSGYLPLSCLYLYAFFGLVSRSWTDSYGEDLREA